MLTPESIVVSLAEAQQLEKDGFPQDSTYFYWVKYDGKWQVATKTVNAVRIDAIDMALVISWNLIQEIYAAPTISTTPDVS